MKKERYTLGDTDLHISNMFKGTKFAEEWQKNVSNGSSNRRTTHCHNLDTEDFSQITSIDFAQLINDRFSWSFAPQGFEYWSKLSRLFHGAPTTEDRLKTLNKKIEEILANSSKNNELFRKLFEGVSIGGDAYEIF